MSKAYPMPKQGVDKTVEEGGSGEAGLYRLPNPDRSDPDPWAKNPDGSYIEQITLYDELIGNTQSNAAMRLGFVRVGDAPEGSIKTIASFSQEADAKENASNKGILARLEKVEGIVDENTKLKQQVADLLKEKEEREAKDGGQTPKPSEEETTAAVDKFNAGGKLNSSDLKLVAAHEGVEVTPELDTNAKLAEAIKAKQAEKKGE